jgi:AraC-like DNA-binding protein
MIASIYLIGIAQGLLLTLNFFKKGRKDESFYWLASLLFATTFMIQGQWLLAQNWHIILWPLFLLSSGFIFITGPLLYLFVRKKAGQESGSTSKVVLHFIPAAFYFILLAVSAYPFTPEHIYSFISGSTEGIPQNSFPLFGILKLVHLLFYTILSFRIIRQKTETNGIKVLWYFVSGYVLLQTISWILMITSFFVVSNLLAVTDHTFTVIMSFYVYVLGYLSMSKSDFLEGTSLILGKKYKSSGLDNESSLNYYNNLTKMMIQENPYLNPELTLNDLAEQLQVKPHQLSQIINENAGTNFSDFINGYRVEKVKALMLEPRFQNLTLLAIAFEAGFNNKNSFNVAFKKHTGVTPTAYKKQFFALS